VVYFPTGTRTEEVAGSGELRTLREERNTTRRALARAIAPTHSALSIVMGDFNTVTAEEDRRDVVHEQDNGRRDMGEEDHWNATVAHPKNLYEPRQDLATFKNHTTWSRIDRVYVNQPPSDQIDRTISCDALEWVPNLSAHRAVAFSRSAQSNACKKTQDNPRLGNPPQEIRSTHSGLLQK